MVAMLNSVSLRICLLALTKGDEMWKVLPSRPGPTFTRITRSVIELCLRWAVPHRVFAWFLSPTSPKSHILEAPFPRTPTCTVTVITSSLGLWWLREPSAVVALVLRQQKITAKILYRCHCNLEPEKIPEYTQKKQFVGAWKMIRRWVTPSMDVPGTSHVKLI